MKQFKKKQVIRRISKYLFEHKPLFATTLLLACLMTALSVFVPTVIQQVLDRIFETESFSSNILIQGIILIGFMFLIKEVLNCLRIRVNNKLEQKVIFKIRKDLHDKLLDLPISFYDRRKSGEIASRVVEDVQNVERAILDGTEQGVIAILTLAGVTSMMFLQEPRLAFLVFLPLPILVLLGFRYAKVSWIPPWALPVRHRAKFKTAHKFTPRSRRRWSANERTIRMTPSSRLRGRNARWSDAPNAKT